MHTHSKSHTLGIWIYPVIRKERKEQNTEKLAFMKSVELKIYIKWKWVLLANTKHKTNSLSYCYQIAELRWNLFCFCFSCWLNFTDFFLLVMHCLNCSSWQGIHWDIIQYYYAKKQNKYGSHCNFFLGFDHYQNRGWTKMLFVSCHNLSIVHEITLLFNLIKKGLVVVLNFNCLLSESTLRWTWLGKHRLPI